MDRRTFCKYLGGGALATTGALTVGTAAGSSLADDYRTVIDVADEGAATDGSESVSGLLERLVDNDTLLQFPPGRYYFDEQVRLSSFWNLGLVGDDATLVPANYWNFEGPQYRLFRLGTSEAPGHTLRIERFTIDQSAPNTGIRAFEVQVRDDLAVEYVNFVGVHDSGTWGPGLFTITDPDGTGYVKSFRARRGARPSWNAPGDLWRGPSGIICNGPHRGTITFEDCALGAFPDNGLYAAGGPGHVNVEGGEYSNSGVASVRLGGSGDVRGASFVVDEDRFGIGQEAIRIDDGAWYEIEDVDISMPNPTGEAIHLTNGAGGATIRNSEIVIDAPAPVGVQVDAGMGPTYLSNVDVTINDSNNAILVEGRGGEVGLVDVYIDGDAGGSPIRDAIRCERDDASFRDVSIEQHGGNRRRGICLLGDDALVYSCWIDVTDRPLSVFGDGAWIQDCGLTSDSWAESVRLFDEAHDVRLKSNWLPDGVVNLGASGVVETATSG